MKENNVAYRREFLEKLSTAELDEMLQKELKQESIDDDLVRVTLSILEEREMNWPVELNEEIAADVERFESSINIHHGAQTKAKWHWTLKAASILLVVGLLLFVAPQVVHAENFFEMLARWTDSIFEFFDPKEKVEPLEYVFETDHSGLQQVYDIVVENGITNPVVPMRLPAGYELKTLQVIENPSDKFIVFEFTREESYILFNILVHSKETPFKYEKDTDGVMIIELGGVEHYVISNLEVQTATWINEGVECSIITNCQKEDLHSILKSIYKVG